MACHGEAHVFSSHKGRRSHILRGGPVCSCSSQPRLGSNGSLTFGIHIRKHVSQMSPTVGGIRRLAPPRGFSER
jgi:hypothetical protein